MKQALASISVLAHIDPALPTILQTDALPHKVVRYALLQRRYDKCRLVQCGSRFLCDAPTRYAIIALTRGRCVDHEKVLAVLARSTTLRSPHRSQAAGAHFERLHTGRCRELTSPASKGEDLMW